MQQELMHVARAGGVGDEGVVTKVWWHLVCYSQGLVWSGDGLGEVSIND
jgi:hypothetical protein